MPGKTFELLAALKETAEIVKSVTGTEVINFASMGAQVGETVSVLNFSSLAEYEEKIAKLVASADYRAAMKSFEDLVVPGASHDHFLRQI